MCLAIPGKVVKLDPKKGTAIVDYEAEEREASTLLLPGIEVGDYVLVQARMIVQQVPREQAREALAAIAAADSGRSATHDAVRRGGKRG